MKSNVQRLPTGSMILSIFGQIEEVAANIMLKKYPAECHRIPTTEFPSPRVCPDLWYNDQGEPVRFAIQIPNGLMSEFEEAIANLRF